MAEHGVPIDVVICTHNRAAELDRTLAVLAGQEQAGLARWRVLVVDNASTDDTPAVVERHRDRGHLPGLRRIHEPEPGLTPARRRGVRETSAPWVAFVDDDNLLEPGWLEAMAQAIAAHPGAGGLGGRVVLDWECPAPSYLRPFGFCFAAQDAGSKDCEVDSLAGAGMVLRREALERSGWLDRPLLDDRIGARLVSGGDTEIALRVHATGYPLRFVPDAVLRHRIPASRMGRSYLLRISGALGASAAMVSALGWQGSWASWQAAVAERRRDWRRRSMKGLAWSLRHRRGLTEALAWLSFGEGFASGVRRCRALPEPGRQALLGAAARAARREASAVPPA